MGGHAAVARRTFQSAGLDSRSGHSETCMLKAAKAQNNAPMKMLDHGPFRSCFGFPFGLGLYFDDTIVVGHNFDGAKMGANK